VEGDGLAQHVHGVGEACHNAVTFVDGSPALMVSTVSAGVFADRGLDASDGLAGGDVGCGGWG